ncbi:MAG: hypothetical protein AB8B81_22555, partial [Halioglobus sp.]
RGPYLSFNPVSNTQIWQWCSAMGDENPCYKPGESQIAPPAMMQMWTMRDINDNYAPGSTDEPPYQVFDDMTAMGYDSNVAVSYDIRFLRYLRVGERPQHFTTVVKISDKKTTALGIGFFVTERVEYLTQDEGPFAEAFITYFQYQAAEVNDTSADGASGERNDSQPVIIDQWRSDFADLDASKLSVGGSLPELVLPITHKLIVGGAIATQDFIPVHHNVPAAREAGMPDIFMNILTTSGLSARYLSDYAGRGSRLQQLQFNLMAPNLPGDTMVMEGTLTEIDSSAAGTQIRIAFGGRNGMGYHTKGSAVLALAE